MHVLRTRAFDTQCWQIEAGRQYARATITYAPRPAHHVRQGRTELMSLPCEQCRPSSLNTSSKLIKPHNHTRKSEQRLA